MQWNIPASSVCDYLVREEIKRILQLPFNYEFLLLLFIALYYFCTLLHILFCDLKKNGFFLIIYSTLDNHVKKRSDLFFL